MIKLVESGNGSFTIENGAVQVIHPQGLVRINTNDQSVGLVSIGSSSVRDIVGHTIFSNWVDATDTPFPTLEALIIALNAAVFNDRRPLVIEVSNDYTLPFISILGLLIDRERSREFSRLVVKPSKARLFLISTMVKHLI
jgi:hypothetical protein